MKKTIVVALVLAASMSLCVAQHWEFEQVDTGGMGGGLHMQRDTAGQLCLAYFHDSPGNVRVARHDSAWRFEDVEIPVSCRAGFCYAVGRRGEEGLLYDTADHSVLLARREQTGWSTEVFPAAAESYHLIFDSTGSPQVVYAKYLNVVLTHLSHAERTDSGWVTIALDTGKVNYSNYFDCWALVADSADRLHAFCSHSWQFPPAGLERPIFGEDIYMYRRVNGQWQSSLVAGGTARGYSSLSLALDTRGGENTCYSGGSSPGGFFYNSVRIDTGSVRACLALDSLNRPHIANTYWAFLYRYLDHRGWHVDTILPNGTSIRLGGLLLDDAGQPIVAYHVPGNGVWLARGVDIVGTEEAMNDEREVMSVGPTVVRGVLLLPARLSSAHYSLLTPAGRKVADLVPGANDVRHLSPGVYFIRAKGARGQGFEGPSRKVVITR